VLSYPAADYAKAVAGVVTHLSALDTPGVNAVTRTSPARPSLNLEHALAAHQLLIVGAPLRAGEVSVTMSSLMLNQLTQRLYERFGREGRPVLLVIDEAPQVARRVEITRMMDVARSAGVGVVAAMQDVTQIKDENERSSIISNAATFAILPGASPASVKTFGQRLGERYAQTFALNYEGGQPRMFGAGRPAQSYATESVPVLRDREIMQPPFGPRCATVHIKAPELGITAKPLLVDMSR
jgi:type IV secretory pathway TraG/TraD family ATPase VirD4